ncbi:C2 calcium-dependent domain-containing protein 6-like [Pygocentrus nattereri]|uniref:C2 calcium-dependent domain-containing protein 6-like n=1 Tax=Pygocentrus nattereri TaxID=42514 RepID=UPI001891EEE5|nr:C2 calcium-dependent domain-containing protein 6-like [Pygocentrus nattereri]
MEVIWKQDAAVCAVLCSVLGADSISQVSKFKLREKKEEAEQVCPPRKLIPRGTPTGVLTVHLKTCSAFSKNAPVKKGTWATVRVTIGGMVKYCMQQPYSDPMCFNEWKHFSLQIQEEVFGVNQSSLMVVELIISEPDTAALRIIGRGSIKLQEILKKSSVSHQFDLRLGRQKVCKLDAELAFTYGSLGYGYSPQIKHAGRTMENLVENSLSPLPS